MPQWEAKEEASETWATNMVKDNFRGELEASLVHKDQPLEKVKKSKSERISVGKEGDGTVTYTEDDKSQLNSDRENLSFIEVVKTLCANTEFLLLMLSSTGFYYVVAGIQYWCPNYLELIM